jgi:hypothetical protein
MIEPVTRRVRALVALVLAALATVAAPQRAAAADGEWFDGRAPAPSGPEAAPRRNEPGTPPALEPSPLLEQDSTGEDTEDRNPEALTKFRPHLDPYGTWIDDPTYGRVWIPNASVVGPNFQPYLSNGRWALDDSGEWIWVSDYPFGWVVFHYGRWVWIPSAGSWAWIPGNQYAPAWVTWRVPSGSYDYVGWAPAPPTFVWFAGVSVWWGYDPYYWWVFCPSPYLFHHHVGYYVVTDPYWQGYAARYTRPYVPAKPRPHGTSPTAQSARRSPSLAAARVPSSAVPTERVAARPPMAASSRPDLRSPSASRRYSTSTDSPKRATVGSPRQTRSVESFRSRDSRVPSVGNQRLAPMRSPSRMRGPDMRASPRAVRPGRR